MSVTFAAKTECPGWCRGGHTDDEIEAGSVNHLVTIAGDDDHEVLLTGGLLPDPVTVTLILTSHGPVEMSPTEARMIAAWLQRAADEADYRT